MKHVGSNALHVRAVPVVFSSSIASRMSEQKSAELLTAVSLTDVPEITGRAF
jgi:hypothetical protein